MLIEMEDLTVAAKNWLRLDKVGGDSRLLWPSCVSLNFRKDPETRSEMESLLADKDFTELRNRLGSSECWH